MGSRRKVPRYRNPSAAHEAKATLYAKPRDPINPVLSSDRVEMSLHYWITWACMESSRRDRLRPRVKKMGEKA